MSSRSKATNSKEKLEVASEIIHMADLDQSMTIGDFRKKVKAQDLYRRELIEKMESSARKAPSLNASRTRSSIGVFPVWQKLLWK